MLGVLGKELTAERQCEPEEAGTAPTPTVCRDSSSDGPEITMHLGLLGTESIHLVVKVWLQGLGCPLLADAGVAWESCFLGSRSFSSLPQGSTLPTGLRMPTRTPLGSWCA